MRTIRPVLLLLFALISGIKAQNLNIKFEEVWTIGNNDNAPAEYLFTKPGILKIDNSGNIYLVDDDRNSILKYDKNGKFIKKYGRLGSGPGEFKLITCFEVLPNDNLLVFDIQNSRYSIIDTKKPKNNIQTILRKGDESPLMIAPLAGGKYLRANWRTMADFKKMFEITSADFGKVENSFINVGDILNKDDNAQVARSSLFFFTRIKENKFAFVFEYDDRIAFKVENIGGKWISNKFISPENKSNPYVEVDSKVKRQPGDSSWIESFNNGIKLSRIKYWRKPISITNYKNKYYIIFTAIDSRKGYPHINAEFYTTDGKFAGSCMVKKCYYKDYPYWHHIFECDSEGNLYACVMENNVYVIKKYKIIIQ
ncbi:MAG: hypothetical protein C0412_01165 [Flavobacterium sp.]|nr:hypothetical protein [Flavobacterium sp.]